MDELIQLDQLVVDSGYGMNHRGRLFSRLVEFYPEYVSTYKRHKRGIKHEMTLHKKHYQRLVDIVKGIQKNRTSQTAGYVYCFFACESFRTVFMKVGRTHSVQKRFEGYVGPMRCTEMVGSLYVRNQKVAEALLLKEFANRFTLDTREWFRVDDSARHEVRKAWVECCNQIVAFEENEPDQVDRDAMSTDSSPGKST